MDLNRYRRNATTRANSAAGRLRHVGTVLILLVLLASWSTPAYANASIFVNGSVASCVYTYCTAASQFGLLVGPNDALAISGTTNILNDIGVDNGGTITATGTVNVGASGNAALIDYADTFTASGNVPCIDDTGASKCNHPAGGDYSTATKVWGGTASNATLVNTAYTQFQDLATYWNGQSVSSGTVATTGSWTISNGINVLSTATYDTTGNVTIGCGGVACAANTLLIVKVTNTSNIAHNILFEGISGLTDDQVLFIINNGANTSNALTIGANGTRNVHANFFLPDGGFTLGNTGGASNTVLWGRVFADAVSNTDTITRNVTLQNEGPVPEPGTWLLFTGGLAGIAYMRHRRKLKT